MYYVLFDHIKSKKGRDFRIFNYEPEVIDFLHENYKVIEVYRIIETARSYRLGLVVTEELIKSVLEPEEETESLVPIDKDLDNAILREKKRKLKELETEEPSAMEKIIDETEEELTDDKKVEKQIDEADQLIEREKKREKQKKKGWKLCTVCNSNRVAPWNKKKICSPCQNKKKTTRPYSRSKEFSGL